MMAQDTTELDDVLNTAVTAKPKAKKADPAKKPGKVTTTKAAPAPAKKAAPKAAPKAAAKPAKAAKASADEVSTTAPDDKVVINAVRKLKEATMASQFAAALGVHRRVIRNQLQRLAKDKANGVKMVKKGFNWLVENTAK